MRRFSLVWLPSSVICLGLFNCIERIAPNELSLLHTRRMLVFVCKEHFDLKLIIS